MRDYDCYSGNGQADLDWEGPYWHRHRAAAIDNFHPQGSSHKPDTRAKLAYDPDYLHVLFSVKDRFVRSVRTEYQDPVYKDSCVELFVQPAPDAPYINFEMNCGGTLLLMRNFPEEGDTPTRRREPIPAELACDVRIQTTAPAVIEPERSEPLSWRLLLSVPLPLLEHYNGPLRPLCGKTWRANLYKCADESSHPHWGSWSQVAGELSFHRTRCFGFLHFR